MLLKDYLITFVLIGIVAFSIAGAVFYLNQEYNEEPTNLSMVEKMNNLEKMQESSESLYNIVKTGSITPGGVTGALFSGIGAFFQLILTIAVLPFEWIVSFAEYFGIPSQFAIAIMIILIICVTFAIISAILRKNI